ncbi:MAG: hypothetical protein QM703_16355 [Gemmatales bacterium]
MRGPSETKRSIALPCGFRAAQAVECLALFGHPVEGVEGDDQIELIPIGHAADISDFEAEVGILRAGKMAGGEGDHILRGIGAEDGATRNAGSDLGGDLAIAAAYIKDAFIAVEGEEGELLLSHHLLEGGLAVVVAGVPFGHIESREMRAGGVSPLS